MKLHISITDYKWKLVGAPIYYSTLVFFRWPYFGRRTEQRLNFFRFNISTWLERTEISSNQKFPHR